MKYEAHLSVEAKLQEVPANCLCIVQQTSRSTTLLLMDQLHAQIHGKGRVDVYHVFPGVDVSYNTFLASEISVRSASASSLMEIFYCRSGRVGWNMQGDTSIYLGTGDLTIHSTVRCAHSAMMLPLGYAEGISISIDLKQLADHCPAALKQAHFDFAKMQETFCGAQPIALPACEALNGIFSPLYTTDSAVRLSYLQLKVQELLLYLAHTPRSDQGLTQYFSQQTELIKEIHALLTGHLTQRFTIEDLSKRYAINTSTLKAVFKTVYGLPIATYMKEYRVRQSMKLLRETRLTIAQIAEQVGYESQGKFTNAFKDVAHVLPTEYRKSQTTHYPHC